MRLQKYMASCGVASRRKCEEYIAAGRVTVNGQVVSGMGAQVEEGDAVCFDGKPIRPEKRRQYLLLNKPQGVVTTLSDPEGRRTVRDLIPDIHERVFPVGRLDYETEGLLLLTNDGVLCHRIIMPGSGVVKEYYAEVTGRFRPDTEARFREGITVDNHLRCLPARIEIAPDGASARIFVSEGKRHQVKRMVAAAGARVRRLKRLAIGGLRLDPALAPGEYRPLTQEELALLFQPVPDSKTP